jgi:hypothetical protein
VRRWRLTTSSAGMPTREVAARSTKPRVLRSIALGPPARVVALAALGALEGTVIALAGQAPHDEMLAAGALAGVLGLDSRSGLDCRAVPRA